MAETPKNPLVLDSFDKKHLQQIATLENKVAAIYAELCKEVGVVGTLFGGKVDLEKVFKLGDYPEINKKVDQIIGNLHDRLGSAIVDGVTAQWQLANEKNDDLVRKVFGKDLDNLTEDQITQYFTSNQSALDAFLKRKDKGLGLSQKVWKYAKEAKVDIESALELGIKTGQSAASMARDLKQYLKEPNKLFRRVRDKDGKLHLSKAAQAYHPGQGVYRSSYKNALRLAVTEANMAYRASDYERVQNFDFVVGIEVRLSNNHTLNGKPFYDICDELKGKYPKDFKFRGWHPFCRCHAITILKTREELMADNERILDGQEPTEDSVNSVNDLPNNFKAWAAKNKSRILAADEKGTLPYFITDNPFSVNSAIGQPLTSVKVPLWYAHNAQVKDIQKELKKYKRWSIEHPKSKKMASLINDADSAILNGESIEKILDKYNSVLKEYKIKLYDAEYAAKKKAEAAKKPTALDIAKKRHEARTQQQIEKIKTEWGKRTIRQINKAIDDGLLPQEVFGKTGDMYMMLKEGNFGAFNKAASPLQKAIARHKTRTPEIKKAIQDAWELRKETILKAEQALSELIPNVSELHKSYSLKKLQKAHSELGGVMNKWLSKYGYSSMDAAPLEHLKNKLKFELTNPSVSYSNSEIIKKAIDENIRLIDRKIEWNGLVAKANSLKSFNTKSKVYKSCISDIDDAINSNNFKALQKSIEEAEKQQLRISKDRLRASGSTEGALNIEYQGGAVGKDITAGIDVTTMTSEDPYRGTFTNNIARMQGFDAPAKLVSEQEFAMLEKACGDVFYRTVNPTTVDGVSMTADEFASLMYKADRMAMNGPGGRVYGDGIYVATSAWDGRRISSLTDELKRYAFDASAGYGYGNHKTLEMTWTRIPKIIKSADLNDLWQKLTYKQRIAFGDNINTFACALGYDGMYCRGVNYMVIWNRSIIAVKKA